MDDLNFQVNLVHKHLLFICDLVAIMSSWVEGWCQQSYTQWSRYCSALVHLFHVATLSRYFIITHVIVSGDSWVFMDKSLILVDTPPWANASPKYYIDEIMY